LQKLEILSLESDKMTGSIPDGIADLKNLQQLDLNLKPSLPSQNLFTGSLPARMSEMDNLQTVYANIETLSGPLPEFHKNLLKCDFKLADYCLL
jgi:hypothetical protein